MVLRTIKHSGSFILQVLISILGISIDVNASEIPRWFTRLQSQECSFVFQPVEFEEDRIHVKVQNQNLSIQRGRFGITAERLEGRLSFNITAKFRENRDPDLKGYLMFDAMMLVLGQDRPPILGNWQNASNLEQFNDAVAAGRSDEDAAWSTWTGLQAWRYGYRHLGFETIDRPTKPQAMATRVEVVFYNNESTSATKASKGVGL
jgi:hypothetical protein